MFEGLLANAQAMRNGRFEAYLRDMTPDCKFNLPFTIIYIAYIFYFGRLTKIQGQFLVFNLVPCVSRTWCAVSAAVCRIEKMQLIRFIDLGDSDFVLHFYLWRNTFDGPLSVIALYWPDIGYRCPLGFAARREYVPWDLLKIIEMDTAETGAKMWKKVMFLIMYVYRHMWF